MFLQQGRRHPGRVPRGRAGVLVGSGYQAVLLADRPLQAAEKAEKQVWSVSVGKRSRVAGRHLPNLVANGAEASDFALRPSTDVLHRYFRQYLARDILCCGRNRTGSDRKYKISDVLEKRTCFPKSKKKTFKNSKGIH